MRRAARVDGNHSEIVAGLRKIGARVVDLSKVGEGVPDILAGMAGRWVLIEIKDPSQPANKRKLNAAQVRFHAEHSDLPLAVVLTVEDAIRAVRLVQR